MKRILAVVLCGLLWSPNSLAADIAFDATSNSSAVSPAAGVVTFSLTTVAASTSVHVCGVIRGGGNVTSATIDASSMTKDVDHLDGAANLYASIFTKTGISAGTHTIIITSSDTGAAYVAGTAVSLTGVATSSYTDDTDTVETSSANIATFPALTTTTDKTAVIDCIATNNNGTSVMGVETNRVERANYDAKDNNRKTMVSTIILKTPAGAVTDAWTLEANSSSGVAEALKPAAAGSSTTQNLGILLGAGR